MSETREARPDPASAAPTGTTPSRRRHRVTREMVQARTRELAILAGRNSLAVIQPDYEQARRELTGETEMVRQEAVLDAMAPVDRRSSQAATVAVAVWENEGGQTVPSPPAQSQ